MILFWMRSWYLRVGSIESSRQWRHFTISSDNHFYSLPIFYAPFFPICLQWPPWMDYTYLRNKKVDPILDLGPAYFFYWCIMVTTSLLILCSSFFYFSPIPSFGVFSFFPWQQYPNQKLTAWLTPSPARLPISQLAKSVSHTCVLRHHLHHQQLAGDRGGSQRACQSTQPTQQPVFLA